MNYYRYRVDVWIRPRSGFELADFHAAAKRIRNLLSTHKGPKALEKVDKFYEQHKGMVLEFLVIETDKPYAENEKEIEEAIEKRFPGAEIIAHHQLDHHHHPLLI